MRGVRDFYRGPENVRGHDPGAMAMHILVTGGAGYIGSHTCVALLAAGHAVFVVDNLCNSKEESLRRVAEISGRAPGFARIDLRDSSALVEVFRANAFDAVIHFAGLKAVGESTEIPLAYYDNNVGATLSLCKVMADAGVRNLVFSSSATVYGDPTSVPVREDFPTFATIPPLKPPTMNVKHPSPNFRPKATASSFSCCDGVRRGPPPPDQPASRAPWSSRFSPVPLASSAINTSPPSAPHARRRWPVEEHSPRAPVRTGVGRRAPSPASRGRRARRSTTR